jgi:ParB family chromosome partitioning protein
LPVSVVDLIDSKNISMGHARALLGLKDDVERQRLAELIAQRGLSVRETENLVRNAPNREAGPATSTKPPQSSVVSEVLRTDSVRVQLHQKVNGAGKIIIEFENPQARDAMLELIKSFEE